MDGDQPQGVERRSLWQGFLLDAGVSPDRNPVELFGSPIVDRIFVGTNSWHWRRLAWPALVAVGILLAGLTVDRAITVMDSNDRLLNSKSLIYVLSSRAREHLGLHVDSKDRLADAVGKHRGDVPHAQDLARYVRSPKGAEREASTDAPSLEKDKSPELAIQIELGGGRQRSFEIGL